MITHAAYSQSSGFEARLAAATARLGPGPFAVRSSGAAEDLADASYAGLYETYLNVEADGLAAAVASCFASATPSGSRPTGSTTRPTTPGRADWMVLRWRCWCSR